MEFLCYCVLRGSAALRGFFFIIEARKLKFGALMLNQKRKIFCSSDFFDLLHRKQDVS